jgi:hypothetical protein
MDVASAPVVGRVRMRDPTPRRALGLVVQDDAGLPERIMRQAGVAHAAGEQRAQGRACSSCRTASWASAAGRGRCLRRAHRPSSCRTMPGPLLHGAAKRD